MLAVVDSPSRLVLLAYRSLSRLWAKCFSLLVSRAFAEFGKASVIQPPVRLVGERQIAIGSGVWVGAGSWLEVNNPETRGISLVIGSGTRIAGLCTLSAAQSVRVGRDVLFARGVYVADHMHAFDDPDVPILRQGIDRIAPVEIGDGAWLGQNAVVGPGVRIGRGAVIGANAVVLEDVPDFSVAVGVPARVIREIRSRQAVAR